MITSAATSIGYDHGSPVSPRYRDAFAFTGTLHEVVIELAASRRSDVATAEAAGETWRQ